MCVETTRFFRRGVVRNRSAMVEYSSTITKQLLTTPRRKNLGKFSVICFSRCGVWNEKSDVDVSKLGKEEGFLLARMFQHRRSCPLGRQMLYRPSFTKVAVCDKDRMFCMFYMMFLRLWWRRRLKLSRVLCSGGLG